MKQTQTQYACDIAVLWQDNIEDGSRTWTIRTVRVNATDPESAEEKAEAIVECDARLRAGKYDGVFPRLCGVVCVGQREES